MQKVSTKQLKSLSYLIDNNNNKVFNFYRVLPNFTSNRFSLRVWNIKAGSNTDYLIYSKLYNYALLNYVKYCLVVNAGSVSSIYLLDRNVIFTKIFLSFYFDFVKFFKKLNTSVYKGWVYTLNFIGLGYKVFLYKDTLFLKLGFCRVLKMKVPSEVKVFARYRNRILLLSSDYNVLSQFVRKVKTIRRFDFYKGKGVFEFTSFDGIKLKVGKQQQFY